MPEFTSEYGVSEDLHPKLPGSEEKIVDFSKGKVGVHTKVFEFANFCIPISQILFDILGHYQIHLSQLSMIGAAKRSQSFQSKDWSPSASRVIDMKDPDVATEYSRTPSAIEKSPLDFDNENPSPPKTEGVASEVSLEEEVAAMGPRLSKKRRRRVNDGADANAPPKVLRKDYASVRPEQSTRGGKSLPTMRLAVDSTFITPADTKGVSDPDPLSYAEPQPHPEQSMTHAINFERGSFEILTGNVATMEVQDMHSAKSAGSRKSTSSPSMVGSPGGIYQPGWGVTNNCRLDTPDACQDVVDHIVSPGLLKKARAQIVRRYQRIQVREEEIKKLDQEVQGIVSSHADNDRGSPMGYLAWHAPSRNEHGKAGRDLEVVEAYDPEANNKYLQVLQELKDLKYPIVDLLEGLKDAPMEVVMASLHLESDSGEDAPKWIRNPRPSTSQLNIHVYPEVRDPRDPWAVKEEMLLEEAIAANVSRAEKKKRCRVVCRTHGVGSAHHARSDGVPVSVPTVAPQRLAILLADATTQTKTFEDDASP
uniref:Transposase (Putative), gypsy type n=1 Tax=Tanacetum cinerariifolium TaxID=118510 RepID=A0A6L2MCV5_TANCI|nr:hypothetical protein [Tanacetum cinerariifolium]